MRADDIPEFIYRGAVVSVDGREQTIKEFALLTPANLKPGPDALRLYLEFKDGFAMEYDASRVREIPGRIPDFIYEGAHIFCKDPPAKNPNEDRFRQVANGEWEITGFNIDNSRKDGAQGIRLMLRRPWADDKRPALVRHFNARTMTPIKPGDGTEPVIAPVYELQNDLNVKKPLTLKRAG